MKPSQLICAGLLISLLTNGGLVVAGTSPTPTLDAIPVCYDFDCNTRQVVSLSREEWQGVLGWLQPAATNAAEERKRIRQAIGWIEELIGRHTPTHLDSAKNDLLPSQAEGQQDCIDESLNTTTYLRLLEREGLLKWHRVVDRAYRKAILDQHWAGQIEEIATGQGYVVDSWFSANGHLPFIQKVEKWKKIRYFRTSFDYTF
ncbi:MAG: hypothetical protein GXP09_04360 [Gammaproteobacteria bacterium]|nr:hypothetical protein [Gammaproteobacteria bacterium]